MTEKKEGTMYTGINAKIFTSASDEIIKFMKSTSDTTFENAVKIQTMNEKMMRDMIEKSKDFSANGTKVLDEFIDNAKKAQIEYKKTIDDGFKKIEDLIKTA